MVAPSAHRPLCVKAVEHYSKESLTWRLFFLFVASPGAKRLSQQSASVCRAVLQSTGHLSSVALHARPARRRKSGAQQPARLRCFSPLLLSSRSAGAPPAAARSKPPLLSRRLPLTLRPPHSRPLLPLLARRRGRRREAKGGGGCGGCCCWGPPASERSGAGLQWEVRWRGGWRGGPRRKGEEAEGWG